MGALRAAELAPYGMEGVGDIYRMYAEGEIDSDAEVALTFDPESLRPMSEPLVNIRRMTRAALAAGVLCPREARLLVDIAREMHFTSLNYPALLGRATVALTSRRLAALCCFIRAHPSELDAKRADALSILDYLAAPWPTLLGPANER
jgi:hypothetical protein